MGKRFDLLNSLNKFFMESTILPSGRSRVQTPARPIINATLNWEESTAFEMTSANG